MMQCKAKSENLAHILGYQIWAVTTTAPPTCSPLLPSFKASFPKTLASTLYAAATLSPLSPSPPSFFSSPPKATTGTSSTALTPWTSLRQAERWRRTSATPSSSSTSSTSWRSSRTTPASTSSTSGAAVFLEFPPPWSTSSTIYCRFITVVRPSSDSRRSPSQARLVPDAIICSSSVHHDRLHLQFQYL